MWVLPGKSRKGKRNKKHDAGKGGLRGRVYSTLIIFLPFLRDFGRKMAEIHKKSAGGWADDSRIKGGDRGMKEERLQEIIKRLEESPDMPYLLRNDAEGMEAIGRIRARHSGAMLVMMRGMRYLTVSDEALNVIIETLERERLLYVKELQKYDRELEDIRQAVGSGRRTCQTRERI